MSTTPTEQPVAPNTPPEVPTTPLEGEALHAALKKQLEYYFSKQNLMSDRFLLTQMNSDLFVPIKVIAGFKMVKALTSDLDIVLTALKNLDTVTIDETGTMVRPNLKPHKNMIILREIPTTTPVEEVKAIFTPEILSKISEVKPDINDFWYITFTDDDSAITTLEFLREQKFKDKPVKARLKTENTFRSLYTSALATSNPNEPQQQQAAVNYGNMPVQSWADMSGGYAYMGYGQQQQQWENVDPNYKGGYENRRGGYRKGGRGNYGNRGRGGHRGQGKQDGQKDGNARKRRDSGGNPNVLQFTPQHFPPLPSQDKRQSGYPAEFKQYTKQQIIDIVAAMKVGKPEIPAEGKVVVTEPNTEIQVKKEWPKKKIDHVENTDHAQPSEHANPTMSLPIATQEAAKTEEKK